MAECIWAGDKLDEEIYVAMRRPNKLFANVDARQMLGQGLVTFNSSEVAEEEENIDVEKEATDVYSPNSGESIEMKNEFTNQSFSDVASMMTCLDSEGLLKKKVLRKGEGVAVSADSTVTANYKLFKENCHEAFDSTWLLPSSKVRFNLGDRCGLLPGLFMAFQSMRVGEISYFLISPKLMYGDFGHPPRIGPGETILAEIEILESTTESTYVEADSYFSNDLFHEVLKLKDSGKKKFQTGKMADSARMYKNALVILQNMNTDCELTQAQKELLTETIGINLAVVYNEMNDPSNALYQCKIVLEKKPENKKALFHYGRALYKMGEFSDAIKTLRQGLEIDPKNPSFHEELKKVQESIETSDQAIKQQLTRNPGHLF